MRHILVYLICENHSTGEEVPSILVSGATGWGVGARVDWTVILLSSYWVPNPKGSYLDFLC